MEFSGSAFIPPIPLGKQDGEREVSHKSLVRSPVSKYVLTTTVDVSALGSCPNYCMPHISTTNNYGLGCHLLRWLDLFGSHFWHIDSTTIC
ncbi:hypothetical protein TNCV_4216971 [Trichonephila clavipes]|nr:hypothetical protein TNCV_4216971 [Trichonephila clavipes]